VRADLHVTVAVVGPWRSAWRRLKRDRWSLAALVLLCLIVVVSAAGGPVVSKLVGHNGDDIFPYATGVNFKPVGPWTRVPALHAARVDIYGGTLPPPKHAKKTLLVFGGDGELGRDEFIRVLDGGRASLEIGVLAVLVALLIAIPIGAVAGYYGGWADSMISRATETAMAFPLLLFLVFASVHLGAQLRGLGVGNAVPRGVVGEAVLIGVFTAFYPLRLVRAQLLTLRKAEFVEATEMVGASDFRILRRHLVPHLVPTMLVWGAVAVSTNILLEVSLSFIGVGVQPQTPTWGSLLSAAWGTIYGTGTAGNSVTWWLTIFPTIAIVLTVVALNQLSEGIRRATDPRAVT
jgi:ABC-type dipeptide/oligopeptide/nickel transport system permease subunit